MPRVGDVVAKSLHVLDATRIGEVETHDADGAIELEKGTVLLDGDSALAMTIAAPTDSDDDGKTLIITAISAQAHVVTGATGFNGSTDTIATFGGAIGDSLMIVAANGIWNVVTAKNVTLSTPV